MNAIDLNQGSPVQAPLTLPGEPVRAEWIDYNGHMNVAYYVLAFDHAVDRFFDLLGLGPDYVREHNHSCFVMENHVVYAREVKQGDPLVFRLQLLDFDAKRLHYFLQMQHQSEGFVAATSEQIITHVDMQSRRSAAMPKAIFARVAAVHRAHEALPKPENAGRVIGIRRPSGA